MVFSYWYKGTYADRTIRDMDMRFITFEESTVQNIVFQNCNLEGSRFPGTRLTGCSFEGCNLWGADFRECTFEQTFLPELNLLPLCSPQKVFRFWKSVQSSFR